MAVLSNTGTVTPIASAETDVVAIAPGTPLDLISVYVQGGAGRLLEYALYTTVGTARTRVAQSQIMGSTSASIIAWQTIGRGDGQTEQIDAGGTTYTVTVLDISGQLGTSQSVTATIAGVDSFDTASDQNFSALFTLSPGSTGTLTTFNGYAQQMDVAIDQSSLPPVLVQVMADNGAGSVQVIIKYAQMSGEDDGIASVFRGLQLPVATRYFVSVTNQSGVSISTTLAAVTYSMSITSGGVVTLSPDVIGPSNANEVVQWAHVPLLLAGSGNMTAPANAAVPIFDGTEWRAFALSGGATMSNTGVVTISASGLTLTGNANGVASANTVQSFMNSVTNADFNIGTSAHPLGEIYVGMNGLTANHTVTLNATPTLGDEVTVKDEDGSLAEFEIIINGNGNNIDGSGTYTMTASQNGIKGAVTMRFGANGWALI